MDNFSTSSSTMSYTINKMTGEMSFVGMFYIIIGAIYCLSIVGALLGIPLIISGLRLRESSDSYKTYLMSNENSMLERAFEKQERFFYIQKIFVIISIVAFVLYIIGMIILFATVGTFFQQNYPYNV